MSASFCAKNGQLYSPGQQSTACGSPLDYKPAHRPAQRSMTAERGFRNMGNIESSFFYERPPKEEALRESVQAPYLEGRKNNNFVNPTFFSSFHLNQSMELQRSKTPEVRFDREERAATTAQDAAGSKCLTTQTPREVIQPIQDYEQLRPAQHETRKQSSHSRRRSAMEETNDYVQPAGQRKQLQSSQSEAWLDVCTGCHNFNLAEEKNQNRRREREAERDLERTVLERNSQLLRADQEKERARKDLVVETSNKNYNTLSQKRCRDSSTEGRTNGDYNIDIKLNSPSVSAESLKCLQRYQSMMDKMYDASVKKNEQRRAEFSSGLVHNRDTISRNEVNRADEKKSGTRVQWNLGEDKSLFDKINEKADQHEENRSIERRRASEHNNKTGQDQKEARKKSPLDVPESPFKTSSIAFEKSAEGKSLLDKMYQSSVDYWKKQKQNLSSNSQMNKSFSALRRSRQQQRDYNDFDRDYTSPVGRDLASEYRTEHKTSFVDKINANDVQSAGLRNSRTRDCSRHNKNQGSEENPKPRENMETYYTSPTKKVGQTFEVESAGWTEGNKGVLHKINKDSAKLNENRKQQLSATGAKNRQQIAENSDKKKEQQNRDKHFKEQALIVCAHKANLVCCGLCNRKVSANKISKVVGDYNKLIKDRKQRFGN